MLERASSAMPRRNETGVSCRTPPGSTIRCSISSSSVAQRGPGSRRGRWAAGWRRGATAPSSNRSETSAVSDSLPAQTTGCGAPPRAAATRPAISSAWSARPSSNPPASSQTSTSAACSAASRADKRAAVIRGRGFDDAPAGRLRRPTRGIARELRRDGRQADVPRAARRMARDAGHATQQVGHALRHPAVGDAAPGDRPARHAARPLPNRWAAPRG